MKNVGHIVVAMWVFLLSSIVFAEDAKSIVINTAQLKYAMAQSALPPGARIVAGDPARNEFYILSGKETPPMQVAENHPAAAIIRNEKVISRIKVALQKTIGPKKHTLPQTMAAIKQANKTVASKHVQAAHIVAVLPRTKTKVVNQTSITKAKVKVASKVDSIKVKEKVASRTDISKVKTKVANKADAIKVKTKVASKTDTSKAKTKVANKTDAIKVKTKVASKTDTSKAKTKVANKTDAIKVKTKVASKTDTSKAKTKVANKTDAIKVKTKVASKTDTSKAKTKVANKADVIKVKTKVASKTDTSKAKPKVASKADVIKTKTKVASKTNTTKTTIKTASKTKTKVLMSAVKPSRSVSTSDKALPMQAGMALKKESQQHLLGMRDKITKNLTNQSMALLN